MKKASKLLALVLAVLLVVAMFAGCAKNGGNTGNTGSSTNTGSNTSGTNTNTGNTGTATDAGNTGDTGNATVPEEPATYTYNYALSEFPTNWNPHSNQTSIDTEIMDYIVAGFYTFDYNETYDGYKLVPYMAAEEPIDVTDLFYGQYGIEEGAEHRAWAINLREDLVWEDGTPITAWDVVESAMRLEDPEAQNYRADSLYSGNMVIHNAQSYLYQGKTVNLENATNAAYTMEDLTIGEDGNYYTPEGDPVFWGVNFPLNDWLSGDCLLDYVEAYGEDYFDVSTWDELTALMNDDGLVPLNDETYALFAPVTTGNPNWGETEDDLPAYMVYVHTYPEMSWEDVGMFATTDTCFTIILDKPLDGFYLLYSLTDNWLVNAELYDSCIEYVDGVYTNTYGTSAETTMSYGPYKLSSFQADKQYVLEKNENFFELNDENEWPTYQTTSIVVDCVPEPSTRLELFVQGKLDSYGLDINDMETYSRSDYCYYTPGDSTFFMAFNPGLDALTTMQEAAGENINKTIICLPEFRMAMSFAMNRADFCLATSPTNSAAFALYSNLIISDPEAGIAYRTTPQAKQVIANFWGVAEEFGEGKLYEDIDEAIDSVTGYNLTKAQQLFDEAYDLALENGLMDEDDVIEIKVGTPNNTSAFYNNGYEYIVNNYTEAVKGTKLEGKLTFSRDDTLGNGFATALQNNQVDMLFGVGWTGSTLDPYGLMEAYVSPNYQYDSNWDTTVEPLTVTIDGVDYTASIMDWNDIMVGNVCTIYAEDGSSIDYSCGGADNDPETRLEILAALENAVLMSYDMIPLMDDANAGLKGQQIQYFTEEYIFGMGRGGIKYYTYNYTDAEWDAYVASNGNELDYT